MAGSEDERGTSARKKKRDRITSLFKMTKDKPTEASEQSTLPHSLGKVLDPKDEPQAMQTLGSSPALSATDRADGKVLGAVDTAHAASPTVSKEAQNSPNPISELWNEAYEELKEKEASLVKDYEAAMMKDMTAMLGNISLAI